MCNATMSKRYPLVCIIYLNISYVYLIQIVLAESRTNFDVKYFNKCAINDTALRYSINITKRDHKQYLDMDMQPSIPIDGNVGMIVVIETTLDGNTFLPLFTIREKDFCKTLNRYAGEFWYDVQRAAQMPVGVCPIPVGRYRTHHMQLNFQKISLQTFPFGILRFTIRGVNKTRNTIVFCEILVVKNMLN